MIAYTLFALVIAVVPSQRDEAVMPSLVFDEPIVCRWCFTDTATTYLYGTPTCLECASDRKSRVSRWLTNLRRAVQGAK